MTETLASIKATDLSSIDLRTVAEGDPGADCYLSAQAIGGNRVEVVFFHDSQRAGVAAGANAEWTDASSAADALRRFLNDDMSL
jgi:hypothetical protein